MKKFLTFDNTETFLNEAVNETYHPQTGAVDEAIKKYVIPCKIRELAKTGKVKILDVCSGIGYNSAAAAQAILEENPECRAEIVGLELDPEIIKEIQNVNPTISFYQKYKKINLKNLEFLERNIAVKVILGDARQTIKQLPAEHFDAVFFDPFSPKAMPEMWAEDFFREIYRVMKKTAIFATFTCAGIARKNMSKTGLFYDDGPIAGRRGPGTVATKWV